MTRQRPTLLEIFWALLIAGFVWWVWIVTPGSAL